MDAHPCFRVHHPCISGDLGWSMDGATQTIYLRLCAIHVPSTFLRLELSMSPLDSSRRADHFAPNESSVAQMGAELCPETCFGRMELSMSKSDSSRRADRFAPNESSVAQMGAELWPETCSGWMCIQNVKAASIIFSELGMIIHVCITGL